MSIRQSATKTSLPSLATTTPQYSQRYEHMTKLANYSEMSQNQIWKQYEKLRTCLKQLNEEVLYHMEKKAFTNLNKDKNKNNIAKDPDGTLVLLEDQKKSNDQRIQNFTNQFTRLEERIKFLENKPNLLQELQIQGEQIVQKMKAVRKQNRDLKRNAQLQGRDLINNTSMLDTLVRQQGKLTRTFKQHRKHEETMKILTEKIDKFKEKIIELDKAIEIRVSQFAKQENFIEEEIHLQRFEQLRKQKEVLGKFQPIYKRNYLMKLKELEALLTSIGRHDKVIFETEANILSMRQQIEAISQIIVTNTNRKRNSVSVLLPRNQREKLPSVHEQRADTTLNIAQQHIPNDKNEILKH